MVEFALVLVILLLVVLGTIEFGLIWYTKYTMAQAAREGVRYGVIYRARDDGTRIPPADVRPSIQEVVNGYLARLAPPRQLFSGSGGERCLFDRAGRLGPHSPGLASKPLESFGRTHPHSDPYNYYCSKLNEM